jgi:hypothetical protein
VFLTTTKFCGLVELVGMKYIGLDWLYWIGMNCFGLDWHRMLWLRLDWLGLEWSETILYIGLVLY